MIPFRTTVWRPSPAAHAYYDEQKPKIDALWRQHQNRDATPYEFFLKTFGDLPLKHPLKHEFLILCWQEQWGPGIQIESRGIVNHWLVRMARGLCFSDNLLIIGCGSSGKTAVSAAYCYTAWKARPFNSSVFLSTTSSEAGESRTWGAIKDWHKLDQYKVGKRIESLHLITLDEEVRDEDGVKERDFRDVIKCVNIKSGAEGKNVLASIVGRKNDYVIWHCDEMGFMDVGVLDARVNLGTNPFNQFIGLHNAPSEGDPMYIDATPYGEKYPDGWRSVDKDHKSWPTQSGLCLHFNGEDSPNFQALDDTVPFPKLMNESFRSRIERRSGATDSAGYWKQFFGFPPGVDISDKLLTVKLLETNGAFQSPAWRDTEKKVLGGLDLGFRADGDPCVIQFGTVGMATPDVGDELGQPVKYRKILALERDGVRLIPRQGSPDPFEVQIARQLLDECQKRTCHDIALDVTGDGGILLQHIEREARARNYDLNVLPVSFSGTAEDRHVIPGDKRTGKEMFQNMVAQLWGTFRLSVLNRVILGMEPRSNATSQLCARKMGTDEKKRTTVEPKKEMKKRIRRSPDYGDAAVLVNHLALKHGLDGIEIKATPKPFNPDEFMARQSSVSGKYQTAQRSVYGR